MASINSLKKKNPVRRHPCTDNQYTPYNDSARISGRGLRQVCSERMGRREQGWTADFGRRFRNGFVSVGRFILEFGMLGRLLSRTRAPTLKSFRFLTFSKKSNVLSGAVNADILLGTPTPSKFAKRKPIELKVRKVKEKEAFTLNQETIMRAYWKGEESISFPAQFETPDVFVVFWQLVGFPV